MLLVKYMKKDGFSAFQTYKPAINVQSSTWCCKTWLSDSAWNKWLPCQLVFFLCCCIHTFTYTQIHLNLQNQTNPEYYRSLRLMLGTKWFTNGLTEKNKNRNIDICRNCWESNSIGLLLQIHNTRCTLHTYSSTVENFWRNKFETTKPHFLKEINFFAKKLPIISCSTIMIVDQREKSLNDSHQLQ
jgi:hypothetical protein